VYFWPVENGSLTPYSNIPSQTIADVRASFLPQYFAQQYKSFPNIRVGAVLSTSSAMPEVEPETEGPVVSHIRSNHIISALNYYIVQ
jgi:hypothetical protein